MQEMVEWVDLVDLVEKLMEMEVIVIAAEEDLKVEEVENGVAEEVHEVVKNHYVHEFIQ